MIILNLSNIKYLGGKVKGPLECWFLHLSGQNIRSQKMLGHYFLVWHSYLENRLSTGTPNVTTMWLGEWYACLQHTNSSELAPKKSCSECALCKTDYNSYLNIWGSHKLVIISSLKVNKFALIGISEILLMQCWTT